MKFSFKFTTALIAVILTVCCMATVFAAADVSAFTDFPAGSWSDAALRAGVNNGLIQGKDDGRIAPKDYITRAETATIINRAFGATVKADISQYTDVSPSKWYYAEMQKAVNMRTVEGVSSTKINPEGYITREQVFAILARALVISDTDETKLMTFADGGSVSSWARGYTAALVNRGYVNGNTENRLKPKDYITREEFAQVMHNIFKQYINGYNSVLSDATLGTTVVRTPNLTLKNLVINGDLIVADGVGNGDITLKNVKVSGRILFRGGEGKVKIEDGTTTGQFVIVHDVNGTVNFLNYRTHPLFKNIVLDTHATFLKPVGGGGGGSTKPDKEEYTITFDGKDYFITEGGKIGDAKAEDGTKLSDAIANYKPEAGYTNKGFKDKATGKDIDLDAKASGNVDIEPINELTKLYAIYDANGGTINGVAVYTDETNSFDKLTSYTLLTAIPVWTGEGNYTFAGWYMDKTTQKIVTTIPAGQVADVTLYAKWVPYSTLTFKYNSAKSDEDTVAIDVVIDKLPYGVDAITYIDAEYSFLKDGTSQKAELTYDKVTSAHGGTLIGTESKITLDGVSITAGGTLFTIEFTKAKDYAENVKFDFGTVTIKENTEIVTQYNKKSAVINALTGLQTYRIEFNDKIYIVYENETIGDARQENNESYTLADAFRDYKSGLDDEIYIFNRFVDADNKDKEVKATDVVSSGMTLTKIVADVDLIKFDVTYDAGDGTVNGKKTHTVENAFDYETAYTLLDENKLALVYEGYEFKGWYMQSDPSKIITEIAKNTKGDVTVYAKWEPIKYDVTYDALAGVFGDGKSTYKDEDAYDADTDYTVKALVPKRDSYVFAGWYFDKDTWLKPAGSTISKNTKADVTLYARWEPNVNLTFVYNSAKSDEDTVAVDVVIDKLPYGVSEIDYIDAVYSFVKEGTDVKAELTYDKVTSAHGGTLIGTESKITLDGVSIKAGGTLFTIEFSKAKDYAENVTFAFGDVVIKKDGNEVEGYNKLSATIDALTGLQKLTIEFNGEKYYVYNEPGATIGSAKQVGNEDYTLAKAMADYEENELDKDIYNFYGYVYANDDTKSVKAGDLVSAHLNLTKIEADTEAKKYDVVYHANANGATVNGKAEYKEEDKRTYFDEYTLLGEDELTLNNEGYKFIGWSLDAAEGSPVISKIEAKSIKGDAHVYAQWQIIEYDVIYDANGGTFDGIGDTVTKDNAHTVKKNHTIDDTLEPKRDGYAFSGWYKEAEAITPVGDSIDYLPKSGDTITIYAGWDKVYKITFDNKTYIAYEGKEIGNAKLENGSDEDTLANAMQKVISAVKTGYEIKFAVNGQNTEYNTLVDTLANENMAITYEPAAIDYAVKYNWNDGGFKTGVNSEDYKTYTIETGLVLPTADHVYKSDAENDYDFKGWYDNAEFNGEPITEIPAGQIGEKEFWAKWEAKPKQGLGFFAGERDEDANTAVMYMTLTEVPYDIDELAYIELDYWYGTQISTFTRNLPFSFVSAEPLFEAESFEARDGKIIWSNHTKPITTAELKANGGKLFKLVFKFDEDISGKRIFKYTENGTVLKAKDNTQSTKYEISDGFIPFNVTYSIITYEQDITNDYDAEPTHTEVSRATARAEEDVLVNYNVTKEGFTIDQSKSNLSGKNDGTLVIEVYYNRNKYTAEFDGAVYNFLYGHKLLGSDGKQGTALKAALQAHSQNAEEGYEWTYTTDTGITLDLEKDYDVTKSLKISAEYGLKKYDIIYYTSATETFVPDGAKTKYTMDDEDYILPRPEKEGFDFVDWYDNKDFKGEPVTKIAKGSKGTKEFWAKWVRSGEAVLKFTHEKNEEQKTITVKVVLTNLPKNLDDLASIEVHYTQTPAYMTWQWDKTKALFAGGNLIYNKDNEGVLTWYNANDPITHEELIANGGELFEIVYTYELPSNGNVVLAYTSETELADSDFDVATPKDGTDFHAKSETVTFDTNYTVETYMQKVTDAPDADPKDYDKSEHKVADAFDADITYTPDDITGFTVDYAISELTGKNDGTLVIKVYYNRNKYTVEFNGDKYDFLYEQKLFQGTALGTALKAYAEKRLEEGFIVTYAYGNGDALDPDSEDIITGEVTIEISEIPVTDEKYTVTFYNGTTDNKGSIEVEAGSYVAQSQVDEKLGSPENYKTQKGYTNSDGVVHEISPELWYKDGDNWKIFVPDKVKIVRDTDVYLLTRYVAAYYDTDFEFRGIKLLQKEIVIPYDSNTDLWESAMDTLVATRNAVASTLYDIELALDVDLFSAMLEKAAKTGIVDADGNILNPEVPVPLHKLITEELIMQQIDNYIDANINNEEFIAEILRNDTVVNMLLEDESIRNKVLSDESMRNKLLTDSVIKEMISKDSVIDWIFNATDFKQKFIDSDETFDYILGDLKELMVTPDYHDMIIDACVDFVIDVYFEDVEHDGSDALVNYIDSVLDSDTFIEQIEENKELRPLFKEEIKKLIAELADKPANDKTKKEIYEEIRNNATIKQSIIDSVIGKEDIMADLRKQVREDLKKPADESKYRALVIEVIEKEFDNTESTLKDDIIGTVQTDLKSSTSTLRGDLIEAVKKDLAYDTDDDASTVSTLKADLIAAVKKDLGYDTDDDATTVSSLKASVITAVQGEFSKDESDIKDRIISTIKGEFEKTESDFKDEVIGAVKTDFESTGSVLKDKVIAAVEEDFANDGALKTEIINKVKTEVTTDGSSLRESILDELSDSSSDVAGMVKDYVRNDNGTIKSDILDMAKDDTQNTAIKTAAKTWIESNIDTAKDDIRTATFGNASALKIIILQSGATSDEAEALQYAQDYISGGAIDSAIKQKIDDEANAIFGDNNRVISMIDENFDTFYMASVDTLFDDLYGDADVFNAAYESFTKVDGKLEKTFNNYIENSANLESAVNTFISADGKLAEAIDVYVKDDESLNKAIDLYVKNPDNLAEAVDFYVDDADRLTEAINFYIEDDTRLEDAIDFYIEDEGRLTSAINTYIDSASDTDIVEAINTYIESDDNLISAVNKYIEDDNKLIEIFNIVKGNNDYLMKAFNKYIETDANLDEAFREFTKDATAFDNFYETHLGVNAQDPELFNTLFEDYYHGHVHEVAKSAYDEAVLYKDYEDNPEDPDNTAKLEKKELYELIMDYVYRYTDELVLEYVNGELEKNGHGNLKTVIDDLMHNELPTFVREEYKKEDSEIRKTVDTLIEKEGKKLIDQYVSGDITDQKTLEFIDKTIKENIDVIVDGYVDGTLRADIKQLVDDEIDTYMNKLINDYINNVGDARKTLGDLIPTYAQDAVDTLKDTDAFKNTISDFTSGNGVRVNEDNIMFISILSELMGEYDYDKIMTDFAPAKIKTIADKIGKELASKYVNTLLDTFVDGIKEAEAKLQADLDNDIKGTEYKFTTTPRVRVYFMDDFVVSMYDKAMPKVADKLNGIELIAVNPYAQKLINKNWITEFLDYDSTRVSEEVSGYSIKKGTYDEEYDMTGSPIMTYYDIVLNNQILLHDAVMWYGDNYTEASIEDKLDAVSALMGTYANKANDVVMHYIQTGELPKGYTPYEIADKILDKVLGVNDKIDGAYDKFEDKYYENEDKILELVDKMKNFYTEKLDKDYTEVIDLKEISVYADGKAYPVYKILLGISDKDNAFNIDTLAEAIDDSDNYHGINALEKGMNKLKSKLAQFEDKNIASALRIIRNAYKFTLNSREIKGHETGTHTVKLHRYFE